MISLRPHSLPDLLHKMTVVTIVLLFSGSRAFPQKNNIADSLISVSNSAQSDSVRVLALKRLSEIYRDTNRIAAIDFAMQIYHIADSTGNLWLKVYGLESLGGIYNLVGNTNDALRYYDTALNMALKYRKRAEAAAIANQLGKSHALLGGYQQAITNFIQSLSYFEEQHDSVRIGKCLNNVGNVYFALGDYKQALQYYFKSLSFKNPTREAIAVASTKNNIAEVYQAQGRLEESIIQLNECLSIYQTLKATSDIALTLTNLSSVYNKKGERQIAEKYIHRSMALYQGINDFSGLITALIVQGNIYAEHKNTDQAKQIFERALNLCKQNRIVPPQLEILQQLYELTKQQRDFQSALQFLEAHTRLKDSINATQKLSDINSVVVQYQIDARLREIDLLKRTNNLNMNRARQREIIITLIVALLVITIALLIFVYNRARIQEKLRHSKIAHDLKDQKLINLEMDRKNIEFKLKAFRLQMNPHFIFNALNSIQGLIVSSDTTSAYKYLSKFSKLLRRVLEHSEKPLVPLSVEIETLNHYVELEKMRFKDDFEYEITTPDESALYIMVPSLLLQPIVENCVKHGLPRKIGAKKIFVGITLHNNTIKYVIEDNGIGRAASQKIRGLHSHKQTSMGLDMIKSWLKAFNPRSSVQIDDLFSPTGVSIGTRVVIQFPIEDQLAENGDSLLRKRSFKRLET